MEQAPLVCQWGGEEVLVAMGFNVYAIGQEGAAMDGTTLSEQGAVQRMGT